MKPFHSFFKLITLLGLAFLLSPDLLHATHFMGGEITYQHLGGETYEVTLTLYRDCSGASLSTSSESIRINGSSMSIPFLGNSEITPICPTASSSCTSPSPLRGVEEYRYRDTITLPPFPPGQLVTISFSSCCRNSIITTGSADDDFYISTQVDPNQVPRNSSPVFLASPVTYFCVGQQVSFPAGAFDADGDDLIYSLVSCKATSGSDVSYSPGFSGTNPLSTLSGFGVDPVSGVVSFKPNSPQIGVFCVLVEEFRNGVKIGEIVRDVQVQVQSCPDSPPVIAGIPNQVATIGSPLCVNINTTDLDPSDIISIDVTHRLTGATFSHSPSTSPATATLCWTPTPLDQGRSFNVVVTVRDDLCPLNRINYESFVISVQSAVCTTSTLDISTIVTDGGCAGDVNMAIDATVTGGVGSLSYKWTGPSFSAVTEDISGLQPGFYTLRVTDSTNCLATITDTVNLEQLPPALSCPASPLVVSGQCSAVATWPAITASDACGIASAISQDEGLPYGTEFLRDTSFTNTFSAFDSSGNQGFCSFDVIAQVADTAPVMNCPTGPINVLPDSGLCSATVIYRPVTAAPDNCDNFISDGGYQYSSIAFGPLSDTNVVWNNVSLSDDQVSGDLPIGFSFDFYQNSYATFRISSNGFITFNPSSASGCCSGQLIPNSSDPNNLIAFAWDDLYPPGNGSIRYKTIGIAPNRILIMEFIDIPFCCGSVPKVTSQVSLYEGSNIIEIHSASVEGSPMTQGVENIDGTKAITTPGRNASNWSVTNDAVRFTYVPGGPAVFLPVITQVAGVPSGSAFPVGTTLNTFEAVDLNGNIASCSFEVTVMDSIPPVAICPPSITLAGGSPICDGTYDYDVIVTDNCGILTETGTVVTEDFESVLPASWTVSGGSANTNCGSVSGSNALQFDLNSTRFLHIPAINSTGFDSISFYLVFGSGGAPCENADSGEDVVLEYSTNGGGTWTSIATYDTEDYLAFTQIKELIPAAAKTLSTDFRWMQVSNSGLDFDAWAIDDVRIGSTVPKLTYLSGLPSGSEFPNGTTVNTIVAEDLSGNKDTCSFSVTANLLPSSNLQMLPANICPGNLVDVARLARDYSFLATFLKVYDADPGSGGTLIGTARMTRGVARYTDKVFVSPLVTTTYWATAVTGISGCEETFPFEVTVKTNCNALIAPVAILQGAFNSTTNLQRTTLYQNSLVPATEPYSTLGYSFVGGGGETMSLASDFSGSIVDWVIIELRNASTPNHVVYSRTGLLLDNGKVVDLDGISPLAVTASPNGSYYVAIIHRNHLGVMTAAPVPMGARVDFTDPNLNVYGGQNRRVISNGKALMYAGDSDGNGQVQNTDNVLHWQPDAGTSGYKSSDFNLDGQVQNTDVIFLWRPNAGLGTAVPK